MQFQEPAAGVTELDVKRIGAAAVPLACRFPETSSETPFANLTVAPGSIVRMPLALTVVPLVTSRKSDPLSQCSELPIEPPRYPMAFFVPPLPLPVAVRLDRSSKLVLASAPMA